MMAKTAVTRAAERAAEEAMLAGHGGATIAKIQQGLRDGRWEHNYAASIGQPHFGWTPGELYQFAVTHAGICAGNIARVRIGMDEGPGNDACREENAAVLTEMPEPFHADLHLTQNCADSDGDVSWSEEIVASITVDGEEQFVVIPAGGSVPLEVGSSNASTVRWHMLQCGGVARWPYGSDEVWLFIGMPNQWAWAAEHGLAGITGRMLRGEIGA